LIATTIMEIFLFVVFLKTNKKKLLASDIERHLYQNNTG
jgi:hypothetical protein